MEFRVGQKVACVDASRMLGIINEGEAFHVAVVTEFPLGPAGLNFSDGPEPPGDFRHWNSRFFRPVTDISIFTEMLKPAKVPA